MPERNYISETLVYKSSYTHSASKGGKRRKLVVDALVKQFGTKSARTLVWLQELLVTNTVSRVILFSKVLYIEFLFFYCYFLTPLLF